LTTDKYNGKFKSIDKKNLSVTTNSNIKNKSVMVRASDK